MFALPLPRLWRPKKSLGINLLFGRKGFCLAVPALATPKKFPGSEHSSGQRAFSLMFALPLQRLWRPKRFNDRPVIPRLDRGIQRAPRPQRPREKQDYSSRKFDTVNKNSCNAYLPGVYVFFRLCEFVD